MTDKQTEEQQYHYALAAHGWGYFNAHHRNVVTLEYMASEKKSPFISCSGGRQLTTPIPLDRAPVLFDFRDLSPENVKRFTQSSEENRQIFNDIVIRKMTELFFERPEDFAKMIAPVLQEQNDTQFLDVLKEKRAFREKINEEIEKTAAPLRQLYAHAAGNNMAANAYVLNKSFGPLIHAEEGAEFFNDEIMMDMRDYISDDTFLIVAPLLEIEEEFADKFWLRLPEEFEGYILKNGDQRVFFKNLSSITQSYRQALEDKQNEVWKRIAEEKRKNRAEAGDKAVREYEEGISRRKIDIEKQKESIQKAEQELETLERDASPTTGLRRVFLKYKPAIKIENKKISINFMKEKLIDMQKELARRDTKESIEAIRSKAEKAYDDRDDRDDRGYRDDRDDRGYRGYRGYRDDRDDRDDRNESWEFGKALRDAKSPPAPKPLETVYGMARPNPDELGRDDLILETLAKRSGRGNRIPRGRVSDTGSTPPDSSELIFAAAAALTMAGTNDGPIGISSSSSSSSSNIGGPGGGGFD